MKKLVLVALALAAFAPVLAAQTASFTGKWEGTIAMTGPDGTPRTQPAEFNLTQKGDVITGTAGPPGRQLEITKGAVKAGSATWELVPPDPSATPFKFAVTIVKGRLQGEMSGEQGGNKMTAKIDAAKAAPPK